MERSWLGGTIRLEHTAGPQPTHLRRGAAGSPSPVPGFSPSVSSLISDISGVQNALGPFRTSCVALPAPLLNVLGIDSLGVRFELVSEKSSKTYPLCASVDIVGLLGCDLLPSSNHQESQSRGFSHGHQDHHEDRLPPVRAAGGRRRQQPQPRCRFRLWHLVARPRLIVDTGFGPRQSEPG